MNLTSMKTAVVKTASKASMKVQKYSPEILLVSGIGSIVTGTVLACRATLKAENVVDEHHKKLETIKEAKELVDGRGTPQEYTEEDIRKDRMVVRVQTGMDFVKLYGPSVALIVGGIVCICSSYNIMRKRNVALVAAYTAVQTAFDDYRKRVIEELGEEKDRYFKSGIRKEKVDTIDENGKKKKETIEVTDGLNPSVYARFFDESSPYWVKNAEKNLMFLNMQQSYANDLLNIHGHVFLNEVYDMLGFPRTQAGSVVGWTKDHGDGYVDFGIYDVNRSKARDFVNGYERAILLDFNVDGTIWNLI